MSEYKLNINLSDEALQVIENARNKINLVKKDNTKCAETAWVARQFEQSNVNWEREYEVFASSPNFNYTPLGGVISPEVMDESNSGETKKNNTGNNDFKL